MNFLLLLICISNFREQKSFFLPSAYGDARIVEFSNGIIFDTKNLGRSGEPDLPSNLTYAENETDYFIVQMTGPVYPDQKERLEASGFEIHYCLPPYGFIGRIKDPAHRDKIRAQASVSWTGIYQPAYKISALFQQAEEEPTVTILLFPDADIREIRARVAELTGNNDLIVSDNGINKIIRCKINRASVNSLARISGVYWIEPFIPLELHNINVQWIVQDGQYNVRNIWAKGIAGSRALDELVNTVDSGINTQHYAHRSGSDPITTWGYYPDHNAIVAYDSAGIGAEFGDGGGYHGTATAGTLTGDDTLLETSLYDGVAKRTRIYFLDAGGYYFSIYPDLNDVYILPYNKYYPPARAHISSNSWGASASGAYNLECLEVDQFMWAHKDFALFFSIGNGGSTPGTVSSPGSAKNVITCGGCLNDTNFTLIYSTSGRGPTQDGRLKPTVLSPASTVISSTSGTNTYMGMSGTSFSSPGAAGAAALVRQYLREGWYPTGRKTAADSLPFISASLLKAVLINGADPNVSAYTVPDNNIGWGRVNLDSALYFAGDTRKLLLAENIPGLLTSERVDYYFQVPDPAKNIKISLAWTDYPGNPAVLRQLVNDLDLSVYTAGVYYRGNQYAGGQSVPNPVGRDTVNVEECVRVNNPIGGEWRVSIEGRNVTMGPQPFSLVITYNGSAPPGVVTLNKPVYRANDFLTDTIRIRVEDTNYGSPSGIDSLPVLVNGVLYEPRPETVWCRELADSARIFTGSIEVLFAASIHGDRRISVCQADSVYAHYNDEDPIFSSTAWAGIDADYFLIWDVRADTVGGYMAEIDWRTSENANQAIYYGTTPGLGQVARVDTPFTLSHHVALNGLETRMLYYYDVESSDFRGNRIRDDNNGNHYTFTTEDRTSVDILVVLADGTNKSTNMGQALPDMRNRFRKAVEKGVWTYDWWETSDHHGDLPSWSIMKDYKAIFMCNEDEYPPFLTNQMDSIRGYEQGGGRIAFSSHDLMWYSWDPAGGNPNVGGDSLWCKDYLHARYKSDISATGNFLIYGVVGDSVTGPYASGVAYSPHRPGADGDTIMGINNPPSGWDTGGVASDIWRWNAAGGNIVGVKWESGQNHGSIGQGVWGGHKTRTIFNAFSVTQLDTLLLSGILNREFVWLIGHDHPDVWITSPVHDSTYTASPITISWYDSAYGGTAIDTTRIEYSPDAGQTWFPVAVGSDLNPPYTWDISFFPNGCFYRVRIRVKDRNLYPPLNGSATTGNFTILIPGNDHAGPRVLPQSIRISQNPLCVTAQDTLLEINAVISDSLSSISAINAATWSIGFNPASPGFGGFMQPWDGSFNCILEKVIDTITFTYMPGTQQICTLWVRGQDSLGNWGNALRRTFTLIDGIPVLTGAEENKRKIPLSFVLSDPVPNPFTRSVILKYASPRPAKISLKIYNCLGQLVRILEKKTVRPGFFQTLWDGCDDMGRKLADGVFFCQFVADDYVATKKLVLVK